MRLYDTARREVVPFEPDRLVTIYTCGITPYDAAHLGHAAVYVTYDVLHRRLVDLGHEVRVVRNITDVDDSILGKARELGVHYLDLAASEIIAKVPDMRPLDAGGLSQATPIESFTAVLLQLNVRYKTRVALRFTGIDEPE